jgi:Tetratricopeptide repeat
MLSAAQLRAQFRADRDRVAARPAELTANPAPRLRSPLATRPNTVIRHLIAGCVLAVALLAAAPAARAQEDSPAVEKVVKLNKKAVDEYQNLNFDKARKILEDALEACSRAGLDNHPVTARTHVHLGVVLFAGLKQKDAAIDEFKKAAAIQSDIKLDTALATPEIQEAFDQAVAGGKSAGEGAGGGAAATSADAITHDPITRATQGKAIPINATLDSSVKAKKVVLAFSADGSDDFGEREMKEESPGNWMAQIPSSATQGGKVAYYIEVIGDDDQVAARKGSAASPMVVSLRGPGGAALKGKKKTAEPAPKKPTSEGPSWFLALGLGSGFGWTTGTGEVNSRDQVNPPGFAWARLGHIAPQVGYFVSPDLIVSVQLRLQLVTGATPYHAMDATECGASMVCNPATYAAAGFGRLDYLIDAGDLHPFVGGMLGGGTIRHITSFASEPHCGASGKETCVDTVASGPIFVGGSAGILYGVGSGVSLMAQANALLGFSKFTFNIDVNAGVALQF